MPRKREINGVLKDITTDYTYDLADRLIQVTISALGETTNTIDNIYNGDGQRIKQDEMGLITKYYYAGVNLLYTTNQNNVKAQEHILDPSGEIVASKRFDGAYENMFFFCNYDIRGSVTSIINPGGTMVVVSIGSLWGRVP